MSKRSASRIESHRPHPTAVNAAKTLADRDARDAERRARAVSGALALGRIMHERLLAQSTGAKFPTGGNR